MQDMVQNLEFEDDSDSKISYLGSEIPQLEANGHTFTVGI
jgi:hypothetical protein